MSFSRSYFQLALGSLILLAISDFSQAQIVRRYAGGGVQIRAPFVRVNVGPGGATSVRAPFTAVDSPGRTYIGRRRRLFAQPQYAAPTPDLAPGAQVQTQQQPAAVPTSVHVDDLPYPAADQLAAMNDAELVETLRQMMARLHHRLSMLNTGDGWKNYLVLSRDVLGSPGTPPETVQLGVVQKMLPRYQSVLNDPQFAKISTLPSFVATFAALQETNRRFSGSTIEGSGPQIADPNGLDSVPDRTPVEQSSELLPAPQPAVVPNAARGERSILKRK